MRAPRRAREAQPFRRTLTTLAAFSGVSAVGGGIELMASSGSGRFAPPAELLAHTPFSSFLVPGLLLALVVGGTSLVAAVLTWRNSPAATEVTVLAGGALAVWIIAELSLIRTGSALQVVYGLLGAGMVAFGVARALSSGQQRQRWVLFVTLGEALGFLAPMVAGALLRAPWLVVAAGLFEGFALGLGQAAAFPTRVRRLRYALLSAAGAGIAWGCLLPPFRFHLWPLMPLSAAVALAALGGLQWLELRHYSKKALRWVGWTALAWIIALPLSFAPAPFVDASTPLPWVLALWACAGAMMAYVMAYVTWGGVRATFGGSATGA
jgi:hypothetical protein